MPDDVKCEALAEYTVYLECREGHYDFNEAKLSWLAYEVNGALRSAPSTDDSLASLAWIAVLNQVAWCSLLEPDVRSSLDSVVVKFKTGVEERGR
jgi:hypothetical protein